MAPFWLSILLSFLVHYWFDIQVTNLLDTVKLKSPNLVTLELLTSKIKTIISSAHTGKENGEFFLSHNPNFNSSQFNYF
jgi:hypothetical protein